MPWTTDERKAKIYYEKTGKGQAIIFIHPPGMGHVTYRGQKEVLKEQFTVITVDLRGNGRSGVDEQGFSINVIAEDVIRVFDECNISSAYICGYSLGGSVAQQLAISYPHRVKGIIIIGGFPEVNSFLLKNQFRVGISTSALNMGKLIANVLAIAHEKNEQKRNDLAQYIEHTPPQILKEYYKAGLQHKTTDKLHRITCPTLLIYGVRDDYVHHYRHYFEHRVTGPLSIILVGNTAHQIPTKKVSALNQIIKNFVNETSKGRR